MEIVFSQNVEIVDLETLRTELGIKDEDEDEDTDTDKDSDEKKKRRRRRRRRL